MSIDYDITTGEGIDYEISADEPITADVGVGVDYTDLSNKPSINGVELVGNKTTQDLHIETGGEKWELINTISVQSGDYSQSETINKDSNGNDFSLKKFFIRIRNVTRQDASTSGANGNLNVNGTKLQQNLIYYTANRDTHIICERLGVGFSKWAILLLADFGTGNSQNYRNLKTNSDAYDLGYATSINLTVNTPVYWDIELLGVRSDS